MEDLGRLHLSSAEQQAVERLQRLQHQRPTRVSDHFFSLLDPEDPRCPLRQQVVPCLDELRRAPGETEDPLAEKQHQAAPGLIHRYSDRALLLTTGVCAAYCRFCTRGRRAGASPQDLEQAYSYLQQHSEVREVILSGGDPLMLLDQALAEMLSRLRRIEHIEVLRVGTRMPVFDPGRITPGLVEILARAKPLFVLVHVNHAKELGAQTVEVLKQMSDAGLVLLSQTVLLRGINDDEPTLRSLFRALVRHRVHPYYLHQCDLALGTGHFRVPIQKGLELVAALRGGMSGICVPNYVIDLPEAGGKVVLLPDAIERQDAESVTVRAPDGRLVTVPNPA